MTDINRIVLKPGKEQSIKRKHPWIFSGAIQKIEGQLSEGDVVNIYSSEGEYLATGHYQIGSIAVRIFSFDEIVPDEVFWKSKIKNAWLVREQLGLTDNPQTNVYRLVNGEGDGMPGLVIDYYNGVAVMQMHSVGMYRIRKVLAAVLDDLYGSRLTAVFDKSESTLPFKANLGAKNEFLSGSAAVVEVIENGNRFAVDIREGQKTGFFIDQRDNRLLLTRYVQGKKVLNMFSYTGGFSVYALRAGASEVCSVDSSANAMEITERNLTMNSLTDGRHKSSVSDAFSFLNDIKNQYDVIILDPPAFAKHLDSLHNALIAYKRLNSKAIDQIKPGGILFTFSCSQVVSRENFRKSVFAAAANSGRHVRILHQLVQPPDHPVSIFHPEGEYLKGLVLYVE